MSESSRQRLAAILAADAEGYSRLMSHDEAATVAALDTARAVFRSEIELNRGRVIDMAGDSVLAVFETATGAVSAALAIQRRLDQQAVGIPDDRHMRFRIGVHLGDLIEKADGTVYGDGVNIAARLQALASPGEVFVSDAVRATLRKRLLVAFEDRGEHSAKNIEGVLHAFGVSTSGKAASHAGMPARSAVAPGLPPGEQPRRARKPGVPMFSVAVAPLQASAREARAAASFTQALTAALAQTLPGPVATCPTAKKGARGAHAPEVRHRVEGTYKREADRATAELCLLDARNARQVWHRRIEVSAVDKLDDGDVLVLRSTLALRLAIWSAETRALAAPSATEDGPMECFPRAMQMLAADSNHENAARGLALCVAGLDAEPDHVPLLWAKAWMLVKMLDQAPFMERASLIREADHCTRRALALDNGNAMVWRLRGEALRLQFRWEAALEANARALALDPSRVTTLCVRALYLIWLGRPEEVFALLDRYARIAGERDGFAERTACSACLRLGRYAEAIEHGERSAMEDEYWNIHAMLAAAYAHTGNLARARRTRPRARSPSRSDRRVVRRLESLLQRSSAFARTVRDPRAGGDGESRLSAAVTR